MFSARTSWHRQPNRLTQLLEERRRSGKPISDLTISNPTESGIVYPEKKILSALSDTRTLQYQPDPRGLLLAREAVAGYYARKNIHVEPARIFLMSSTSEAYSFIFKLTCNPGDSVLVPCPSYPLFDYIPQLSDVLLQHYSLRYDGEWHIDLDSIRNAITSTTRAIILIHPHNPTGMFLKRAEYEAIKEIALRHGISLIVDEVFLDYAFGEDPRRVLSTAGEQDVLTFTLNGLSKTCGLPQMKLAWMVVTGPPTQVREAMEILEILSDTFLSVNTPVQVALPELLKAGDGIGSQISRRTKTNFATLQKAAHNSPCSVLASEGGWYAILRVPRTKTDEEWSLRLLDDKGIYVHPGYFFDFEDEGYLVVSLLTEEKSFEAATGEMLRYISQ